MASRQQQYYDQVYNAARDLGYSDAQARVAAAQSSLETGYGKSAPGNAFFGIKAGPSWNGPTQTLMTWEEENGRRVNQHDKFRAYDDPSQSLIDWGDSIRRSWPDTYAADTFPDAVDGLQTGTYGAYASDHGYGSKLRAIDQANSGPYRDFIPAEAPVPSSPDRVALSAPDLDPYAEPSTMDALGYAEKPSQQSNAFSSVLQNSDVPTRSVQTTSYTDPSVTTGYRQAPTYSQADMTANGKNSVGPQLDYGRFSAPSLDQTTSQLADEKAPAAPEMSMADQRQSYGLGRQALETATAPTVANLNMLDDFPGTKPDPNRISAPVAPVTAGPTATLNQPISAPEQQPSGTAHTSRSTTRSTQADGINRQNAMSDTQKLNSLQQQDKIFGGIAKVLGGVLGTAVLGPLGGVLGAVAAPALLSPITNQAGHFYPTAPVNPGGDRKGYGYGSLSDNGRSAYESSGQFRDAVSSGKGGLW